MQPQALKDLINFKIHKHTIQHQNVQLSKSNILPQAVCTCHLPVGNSSLTASDAEVNAAPSVEASS
ncbi:hypothetical protein DPMN_014168 [Dreissena polymorpha]|uniref:Uncharacterized protein n=1 Tax=Dreissena polymorpha TaxID=45954 RepID=A0A9D4NB63_DREPO|nr:hypothetical protein DPMN_014168 [Dreissena polymorpha]